MWQVNMQLWQCDNVMVCVCVCVCVQEEEEEEEEDEDLSLGQATLVTTQSGHGSELGDQNTLIIHDPEVMTNLCLPLYSRYFSRGTNFHSFRGQKTIYENLTCK